MGNVTVTKPWKDMISHQLLCWNTHSIERLRNIFQLHMWLLKIRLCVPVFKKSCQKKKKCCIGISQQEYFECIWIFARHHGLVPNKKRLFIMRFLLRGVWRLIRPSEVFYSYPETSCGCCWGRRPALPLLQVRSSLQELLCPATEPSMSTSVLKHEREQETRSERAARNASVLMCKSI